MMSFGDNQTGFMAGEWVKQNAATFRNSPWIEALNETLRCELAAVEIYCLLLKSAQFDASEFADEHAAGARKIAVLVIAQRGIPADRPAPVMAGFNKAILQFCKLMPDTINRRFTYSRLAGLEKQFCLMYAILASRAPNDAREIIDQLGTKAADRQLFLTSASNFSF